MYTERLDQFFDIHFPDNTPNETTIREINQFFKLFSKKHKTGIFMTGIEKIIKNKEFPGFYFHTIEFAFRVIDPKDAIPPKDIITGKISLIKYRLIPVQISNFHPDTFDLAVLLKNDLKSYFN